jgi:PAS domain S-box-containing protein/putative nucleotidyltransferase with HDIG domain
MARMPALLATSSLQPGSPCAQSFEYVAERMSDGVIVISPQSVVGYCNPALARLLGHAREQVVGRPVTEFMAEETAREFASRQRARRSGDCEPYVAWMRHADGRSIERQVSPSPLFDQHGRFEGSIAIIGSRAVGQVVDAESALARRVLDSSDTLLYRASTGPGQRVDFVSNNIALYGHSARELVDANRSWASIVHPLDRERIAEELTRNLDCGLFRFRRQYRLLTRDRSVRWVEEDAIVWTDMQGGPQWIEGLLRDVTAVHEAQQETQRALAQTVETIGAVVDKRDPYTGIHQHRVADLAMAIGRRLNLKDSQLEGLYLGALIHDVGKVAVPSEVLARPGRLSAEELALVRTHVQVGVDMIRGTPFPWPLAQIIAQHHERLDGSGYPYGLSAGELLLEARIVAVADVFESMASHRPYRPALGVEAALAELRGQRGRLYCPAAVDGCTWIVEASGFDVHRMWEALGHERKGDATSLQLALDLSAIA